MKHRYASLLLQKKLHRHTMPKRLMQKFGEILDIGEGKKPENPNNLQYRIDSSLPKANYVFRVTPGDLTRLAYCKARKQLNLHYMPAALFSEFERTLEEAGSPFDSDTDIDEPKKEPVVYTFKDMAEREDMYSPL